ncbi:unnamed protein product [Caenorhabditis angaria]|uniref:Uncharacterized protein n=1 Tax=Caenorhabditis angaria TaxID=860376 RepID=A0A9P1IMB5_9PELO|nr:unnamed protein product [Caenorhabditis angaria]
MARVASQVQLAPPNSQQSPAYYEQSAKSALIQLIKISRVAHRGRATSLAKNPEVQTLLDNDIFLIQPDRRSKLTPIQQYRLVHVLAQFFLERVEDGNRYSYFEAIFLGREGDSTLHDFRIDVLLQLASFSLQFPVLQVFNHVSNWLSKIPDESQAVFYSNLVVEMLVDHYIKSSDSKTKMHEYLKPLETSCGEFTATFVALAPLHCQMNSALCSIISSFMNKHLQFLLRHLRDTPYLGDQFAKNTFPIFVRYILSQKQTSSLMKFQFSVAYILRKWDEKVIGAGRATTTKTPINVLDILLSDEYNWNDSRCSLLASSSYKIEFLIKKLEEAEVDQKYIDLIKIQKREIEEIAKSE